MREVHIGGNEAGQRLDKFLAKYMRKAPKSFFYKMLRKKNIVLNGKKATGSEKLKTGDQVRFFLAKETLDVVVVEDIRIPVGFSWIFSKATITLVETPFSEPRRPTLPSHLVSKISIYPQPLGCAIPAHSYRSL